MKKIIKGILLIYGIFGVPFLSNSQTVPSYVPTNGLIGWWPFNGNANDSSGNGRHGNNSGATLTTDRFGLSNSAYQFNGSNNRIILPTNLNGALSNLTKYTISGYFNSFVTHTNGGGIFSNWKASGGDPYGFSAHISTKLTGTNCAGTGVSSQSTIQNNQWYHFAAVFDGTNSNALTRMKLFINGVQVPTDSGPISYSSFTIASSLGNTATHTAFGAWFSQFGWMGHFNGKIDDIAMWNRALTPSEIYNIFAQSSCQDSITTSPIDKSGLMGSNQVFNYVKTGSNRTYQWQSNAANLGWQNISNNLQYSGATTNSLSVSNINLSNHNQFFRAITQRQGCAIDTSNNVKLTITNFASDSLRLQNLISDSISKLNVINALKQDTSSLNQRNRELVSDSNNCIQLVNTLKADTLAKGISLQSLRVDSTLKKQIILTLTNDTIALNATIRNLKLDTTSKGIQIRQLEYALANKHDTVYVSSVITSDTLKISITTGLSSTSGLINRILVYPNPASTLLYIDLQTPGHFIATMTGVTGQTVITPTSGTIDISTLANGLYILNIYDHDNKLVSTNKVMILR